MSATESETTETDDDSTEPANAESLSANAEDVAEDCKRKATTVSTKRRWVGLTTVLGLLLAGSVPVIVGLASYGLVDLSMIPRMWFYLYAASAATAVIWAFGGEAFSSAVERYGK